MKTHFWSCRLFDDFFVFYVHLSVIFCGFWVVGWTKNKTNLCVCESIRGIVQHVFTFVFEFLSILMMSYWPEVLLFPEEGKLSLPHDRNKILHRVFRL